MKDQKKPNAQRHLQANKASSPEQYF